MKFRQKKRQPAAFELNRRAEKVRLRKVTTKELPFALYYLDKTIHHTVNIL
jgi:hypothetical protein